MKHIAVLFITTLSIFTYCFNPERNNPQDTQARNYTGQLTKAITASDGVYIDKIEVSWEPVTKDVIYHLYRADKEEGPYALLSSTNETSYADQEIEPQKKYYYWIKIEGDTIQFTPDSGYSGPLTIPVNIEVSQNQVDKITVAWEPVDKASSYAVYRSTQETGDYSLVKTTDQTSYDDYNVEAGQLYFYKIKSYADHIQLYSDYSNSTYGFSRNLYTTDTVTVSTRLINKIIVYWTTVNEASEYYIYRADSETGDYIPIAKTTANSYEDSAVVQETVYYYKIKTHSTELNTYSQLSSCGNGFACLPLSVPESITATQGTYADRITINWNTATGATSYTVYRSTDKDGDYVFIGNSESTNYNDYTAVPGTFYYYKVTSYSACLIAESDYSIYAKGISVFSMMTPAGIILQKVPAGFFYMGQEGISGAEPVHLVTLTNSFYMGKYEITWSQWRKVRDWAYAHGYTFSEPQNPGVGLAGSDGNGTDNHPVTSLSWYDAVKWCNALSEYEGRTPAYYTDYTKSQVYRSGEIALDNSSINWSANGYRLPTEAEWEWAARAGTSSAFFWGEDFSSDTINQYSWYYSNSNDQAQAIGQKLPNNFNLYDMTGNVREWCWDLYAEYSPNNQINPQGPASGTNRIMRGGGFRHHTGNLYLPIRESFSPLYKYNSFGLRVVTRAD